MHILLLKNNEIHAQTMIEGAKARGWTVTHVFDIFTAKMALLDNIYTIILIDLDAEQELRLAILHGMRQRYDVTPVLLMTEQDLPHKRIAWLEAGADDCLVNPFEIDELWARVRAVTRRSEGQVVPLLGNQGKLLSSRPAQRASAIICCRDETKAGLCDV